ncbi:MULTISPECIES: hypothetical protein [unclassified Thalassolituus]|jgi:hypothetical protein|uniref:hypothetical protein n=1 Tax=Oceanospirillaceae TaxID=135620 RepID=UPI000C4202EF|nr:MULTISPECIES: hypothetical protein [unclassified Thalassolituus]MAY15279.1 hypothetical protein [Oceanospirillaceae bacterium]MBU2039871.1 hypothetical protein [Gammaproteobacteria bacterium]PIQ39085.1 MAG: hypothetical protein COW58_13700 [Thalassolituus sp. CG17_big_fil_post_rev_8_21_14_2_50_53_8]MCA6060547.1 hypothetical protein [Thalassolituus sp. ST750PaO-4]TVV41874.1 hypothetical protein FOT50_17950 [Thalassolituus sp. C2-1]
MGLKEKKAARDFEQDRLDSLKAQIFEAAKFEFEIEIKWDTITIDGYSHLYDQTWPLIYFEPVIIALKELCADDFCQEAVQADLKKIVIENDGDIHNSDKCASYSDGVLTINHSPIINAENQVQDRAKTIREVIENAL